MIHKIALIGFRNFDNESFSFSDKITFVVGPNASGKTNLLEALYLVSSGKSFRAGREIEMIKLNNNHSRVSAEISDKTKLEVFLSDGSGAWPKKRLTVNGVSKRLVDFAGRFKATLFGPWDMEIVIESPSVRRRFLDAVLSQTDREYRRCLMSYEKGLKQRNKLLFRIREEGAQRSQLLFWDQLLIKNGDYLAQKRQEFIEYANASKNNEKSGQDLEFRLEYDRSVISEGRLAQYAREEIMAATTLVGPHRDDFRFWVRDIKGKKQELKEKDLAIFGSRGEQRMGVLWLKMAELNYVESVTGDRPTLLLDDIFSELDHKHREIVNRIAMSQQTIVTTADEHFVENGLNESYLIISFSK